MTNDCAYCGRRFDPQDWDGQTPCPSDDCPSHELPMAPDVLEYLYNPPHELPMAPDVLEDLYSPEGDGEHPLYPRRTWREQVANEYTISGYWQWVSNMLHNE